MSCVIKAKFSEIAHMLGINVEGRLGELRALIREMVEQEQGRNNQSVVPNSRRKPKRSRELSNLVSTINYDKHEVEKKE